MKKIKLPKFAQKIFDFAVDKSPELLAITAAAGVVGTALKAYKCRPKCDEIIERHNAKLNEIPHNDTAERRSVYWQTTKELIPVVAPVFIIGAATIASIAFSHRISKKRILAITAAYNLAENSLKDLQNKMNEVLGENKVRDIKDKIMKDKVDQNPPPASNDETILSNHHKNGDVRCYESFTGRYFWSNANAIKRAINEITAQAMRETYVTINDFFALFPDLPEVESGMNMGWRSEDAIRGSLPITISAQLTKNDEPCLCIDYNNSLVMV